MYWLRIALFSIIDREEEGSNNYIIAKYLLKNYNNLSGVSLTEISKSCNLSKAAVSRFCKELGLMDYIDLQMLIRTGSQKERVTGSNMSEEEQKADYYRMVHTAYEDLKSVMAQKETEDLIHDLKNYEHIYAFGHLQASHIAYILGNSLAMYNKFLYTTQSWPEQVEKIEQATSEELIIIFSASGDYFKRLDINLRFLKKENAPKVYLVTFGNQEEKESGNIHKIFLGEKNVDLQANVAMNMFVNYVAYRYRKL